MKDDDDDITTRHLISISSNDLPMKLVNIPNKL